MIRHTPVIALVAVMCAVFVARNWWTPLLADGLFSIGLPFGLLASFLTLSLALPVIYMMPLTDRRVERLRTTLLLLSITVCSLAFDIAYSRGLPTGSFATRFDSARWRDEDSATYTKGDVTARQKMLGSVVYQILPKANRPELEGLLGEAKPTGYFTDLRPDLLYCLGPERGFIGIDSEWLAIWFDEDSIVERWELLTD